MNINLKQHRALLAFVLLYLTILAFYSRLIPPFEGPDEGEHFAYVTHLMREGALPHPPTHIHSPIQQEVAQAPLYYMSAAGFGHLGFLQPYEGLPAFNQWWTVEDLSPSFYNRNRHLMAEGQHALDDNLLAMAAANRWLRRLSWAYGIMALLGVYVGGLALFRSRRWALFCAMGFALTPQLLQAFNVVSNDVAVIAFSACIIGGSLHLMEHWQHRPLQVLLGVLMGCAALSKASGLVLWAVPPLALTLACWQQRGALRALLQGYAWLLGPALLLSGWWFLRGWWHFDDPLGTIPHRLTPWGIDNQPTNPAEIVAYLRTMWVSLWANYGWGNLRLPPWAYLLPLLLVLLAALGWLRVVRRWQINIRHGLLLVVLLLGLGAIAFWLNELSIVPPRLYYPYYPALILLLGTGLHALPARWLCEGAAGALGALCIVVVATTLQPAYGKPLLRDSPPAGLQALVIDFPGARFLGYQLDSSRLRPGELRQVRMCWQGLPAPAPYPMERPFVLNIFSPDGVLVAGFESLPGLGRYTLWQPQKIFCDDFPLLIGDGLTPATAYSLDLSLFDPASQQILHGNHPDGSPRSSGVIGWLGSPAPPRSRSDYAFHFGGIGLLESELQLQNAALQLSFQWGTTSAVGQPLTQFIHVLDANGNVALGYDPIPGAARYPIHAWGANEMPPPDRFSLSLEGLPPGSYQVLTGLYRQDGTRLPAYNSAGEPLLHDAAPIGSFTLP